MRYDKVNIEEIQKIEVNKDRSDNKMTYMNRFSNKIYSLDTYGSGQPLQATTPHNDLLPDIRGLYMFLHQNLRQYKGWN